MKWFFVIILLTVPGLAVAEKRFLCIAEDIAATDFFGWKQEIEGSRATDFIYNINVSEDMHLVEMNQFKGETKPFIFECSIQNNENIRCFSQKHFDYILYFNIIDKRFFLLANAFTNAPRNKEKVKEEVVLVGGYCKELN